jgi:hypothetical protein
MKQALDEQRIFRNYLLHELGEEEQDRLEERFLTDKEFGRLLAIAEADLIDDFVAGTLSESEAERFRKHFLTTPARLEKLKFAMALDMYVARESPAKAEPGAVEKVLAFFRARPLEAAFSVLGAVLILGAGLFLMLRLTDFQALRGDDLRQELVRVNREGGADSVPLSELRRGSAGTPVLSLTTDPVREDAGPKTVELTSGVKLIRLLLEVSPKSYDHFRAMLQTDAGDDIATVENLKARDEDSAQFVVVNVPPGFFSRGDFQIRLFGFDGGRAVDLGLYSFRVTTR